VKRIVRRTGAEDNEQHQLMLPDSWMVVKGGWPTLPFSNSQGWRVAQAFDLEVGQPPIGQTRGQTGRIPSSNSQKPVNVPSVPRFSQVFPRPLFGAYGSLILCF